MFTLGFHLQEGNNGGLTPTLACSPNTQVTLETSPLVIFTSITASMHQSSINIRVNLSTSPYIYSTTIMGLISINFINLTI